MADLKHLGWVKTYSAAGYDYVSSSKYSAKVQSLYASSKESSMLKPGLETIEGYLKMYGTPLYEKAVEKAPAYLATADAKVDASFAVAKRTYEDRVLPSKPVKAALELRSKLQASHPDNLELFKKARDEYFKLIETSIESLKAKGVSLSSDALASLREKIAEARVKAPAEAKAVFQKAAASWEKLAATPAVASALEKVLPKMVVAKEKALTLLSTAQESTYYKSYVEPTLGTVTGSKYYALVAGYVKPLIAGPVASN